jgi:hypothetical protein
LKTLKFNTLILKPAQSLSFKFVGTPKNLLDSPNPYSTGEPVLNSNTFPISLIAAAPSPIPYILLFLIVLIIAIVLFVKFPSLRKYRKTRNILFYFLVAVALVLTLFQAYEAPRRTVYEYFIYGFPNYDPGRTNQFNLTCQNLESTPASFYMVINSVNASFPTHPQLTYIPVNSTAIKVLFTVSENTSPLAKDTEPIFFYIDENVTGFSFTTNPQTVTATLFSAGGIYGVDYVWNGLENYYELSQLYQVQS